jgi:hypothetical protein
MKTGTKVVLSVLNGIAVAYLLFAYTEMSLDPADWKHSKRELSVMVAFTFSIWSFLVLSYFTERSKAISDFNESRKRNQEWFDKKP